MPDWGGWVDKGIDLVDKGVDKAKEKVGEGVDWATDQVGDGLDKVGAHEWADAVEDWGDETASSLGAEVGEQQLGQTEEANELIHGNPGKIAETVKNLRDFQMAFGLVGAGMKRLDSSQWKGEAAEAFRKKFQTLPTDWLHATDAFDDAAKALETYSKSITSAQGKAKEAIALYKEGDESSKTAVDAYNKKVDAYNAARNGDNPLPKPGEFSDPGTAKRERAQEILKDARSHRNEAAEIAKKAVTAAMAHAPKEPTGREKLKLEGLDYALGQSIELAHFGGGIVKGTAGVVNFVRSVNPIDAYNLTHPAEYWKGLNMTLAGLASTVANPDRALKNAWDAAKGDPAEFLGRLVPELLGTKGTGGLKGLLRSGAKDLAEHPKGKGRHGHDKDPDDTGRKCTEKTCKKDPVDVATGRMVLPQTDIALPASLPLLFQRTFESSYRAGGWFGPTWASTADQRLEIDSEGVVFICEDGSMLAYPHPAPGVPVMPTHGRRWPLDCDTAGDYTVTDPDTGQVWHFATRSAELALLVQVDDRNGRWITFEYDETDAPVAIVHHGGYHLKLTTDDGRITALHLASAATDGTDQEILRYGYADGHLTEVTNSSGCPLRFGYDGHGRITSWTDTNGSHFDYVYDDRDRCTAQSGANGHLESRFTWDDTDPSSGLRITSVTDGLGHTERFLINDRAQIVAEIDATGAVTRFERDRYNRVLSVTNPLGHISRSTYDESGRLITVVRPDGRALNADYNELGLPVRVQGADGTVTRQTYDERGNCTSVTDVAGATTQFSYDEAGHLTSVTDALGHSSVVRRDRAGLPVEVTDSLGATTRYERDAFGRPVTVTDPLGGITRIEWTLEGKISRRIEPDGSEQSWAYDGEGNCLSHTDAVGGISTFEYADFDLMVGHIGPDGVRYRFSHDSSLRLTRVTSPQGLTWDYEYDAAGRLISETDFDSRRLTYTYDKASRLTSQTNGLGQTVRFEHNELGQVLRKDAEGAVTSFEYDIFDELASASGPDATLVRLRDRFGRLKSETVNGRKLTFNYDAVGRRTARTTPSGAISSWTYDAAGNRTQITTSGRTLTFEHDAAGRELARFIGESVTLRHAFDATGRLVDQHVIGHGRELQRRSYTYRADGHLVGIDDQLSGPKSFDLDVTGRVTAVHAANWTERYSYDAAGNQTEASWPASHPSQEATGARAYTGTRITRAGDVRYEHDAQGRIVLRQKIRLSRKPDTWRYQWDAEDRLASVIAPDGAIWRYLYDALGRRIAKQRLANDGQSVLEHVFFSWDGATLCEQTSEGVTLPNTVTLTWDYDGLRPLAQTERILTADAPQQAIDERFFSIVTDLVGTPSELIDESGALAWHTRSTLWGTTTWATTSTTYIPLRFPGQYFDPETGLHYNYFRHYDPETARYLSADPLGLIPGPNPAAYVHNPHTWFDPLGLSPCRELGLSDSAQKAIDKLENIKRDPVGDINSQPNHNHYDAARREANGEVVARKPDGTPFDHISDLKQARNGLDKVRRVLESEMRSLPDSLTERGLDVLLNKHKETTQILDRLNGFLHSIGHG
ncbi:putative T7SS-secreted protein [Streptomyces sp. NBC_01481]|uniref:putative T7SS-secreted protein n=1 Tax=Streptomyces sp. NBC_01481 TaxID=2975869 RepID=UPI00224F906C|nr:polymorphic toxin type 28 domain-containing protein [Streptomyces sp. NBC_01481]MCX4588093.1 polymorphic toxin type 28 domain-containing protein [Streptomyces sp. NBC_01481]